MSTSNLAHQLVVIDYHSSFYGSGTRAFYNGGVLVYAKIASVTSQTTFGTTSTAVRKPQAQD